MATSSKSIGRWWSDLPLFAEGTLASLSVKQVIAKVKRILATCGLGYDKPLANYDPGTQSWKMSVDICPSGEPTSLPTLPPSGMTRNGALFQQPAWERLTDATASSSWPTPTAVTRPMEGNVRLYRAKVEAGEMTEAEAEAILGKSVWEAQGKLKAQWPTLRAALGDARNHTVYERSLDKPQNLENRVGAADPSTIGGKLNPMWVEWLMGFPLGWTDLED